MSEVRMTKSNQKWFGCMAALAVVGWAHPGWADSEPMTEAQGAGSQDVSVQGAADRYVELRAALGFGGTNSTRPASQREEDEEGRTTASLNASAAYRRGWLVFGAIGTLSSEIFSADHYYLGGLAGIATPGDGVAHIEALVEGGAHVFTHVGKDLFTSSSGETSGALPYVGAQVRLAIDPGVAKHLAFDLTVAGRSDLGDDQVDITTEHCFWDCSTKDEQWKIGGQSFDVSLGLRYLF